MLTVGLLTLLPLALAQVVHYPPNATNINNLAFVVNGTGAPGIYNSSTTPSSLPYSTYNWCNMPHVRAQEYVKPSGNMTLAYVEVIQRHQKRTPYGSNTFFKEDVEFQCPQSGPIHYVNTYGGVESNDNATAVQWEQSYDANNPFTYSVGPGFVNSTCQFPQITSEGQTDAYQHGLDIASVYRNSSIHSLIPETYSNQTVAFRVTNNVITSQVAGGLVSALFSGQSYIDVAIQSSEYDSLEPTYSCPAADAIKAAYVNVNVSAWESHFTASANLSAKINAVNGIPSNDTAGWHTSYDHIYDNLSAKQCHGLGLPCSQNDTSVCITQAEADQVYRLGNYEYSYYWRDAQNSTQYAALHYGAFILELLGHIQDHVSRSSSILYRHNVAHDGSISPLLAIMQISSGLWPGMGSEIVFELYKDSTNDYYIRVLWSGQPMITSTPLGTLDMIPLGNFTNYLEQTIGNASSLYQTCSS